MMKLYTCYTPSHRVMYENYFLPSLPNEFDLIVEQFPQDCPTGSFYTAGWGKTMQRKAALLLRICEANMGKVFVFSDVDVQFFGPIKQVLLDELGDFDIACQDDFVGQYCAGFFICRANAATLALFRKMAELCTYSDQVVMNEHISLCKAKFLSSRFYTVAHSLGGLWTGQAIDVPANVCENSLTSP